MVVIGLTGPSGAGKSAVCALLAKRGIPSLNADAIYRELLIPPSDCLNELVQIFGNKILCPDGTLDRRALRAIAFSDREALARLDAVAHRYIMAEIRRRLAKLRKKGIPAVILDAPQLFEANAARDCDVVISVLANEPLRVPRIMRRDGISETDARRRIRSQYSDAFFREHSNYILENNGTPEDLNQKIDAILRSLNIRVSHYSI